MEAWVINEKNFLNMRKVPKKKTEHQEKQVPGNMQRMDAVQPHKYKLGNKQLYDIFVKKGYGNCNLL